MKQSVGFGRLFRYFLIMSSCQLAGSILPLDASIKSRHTADSKPVKQEVHSTVILPPLVFPGFANFTTTAGPKLLNLTCFKVCNYRRKRAACIQTSICQLKYCFMIHILFLLLRLIYMSNFRSRFCVNFRENKTKFV